MERKDFTVEVFKIDGRTKTGVRLVKKVDHTDETRENLEHLYKTTYFKKDGFEINIVETWIETMNAMTGKTVRERYDTPYYLSVGSESYWSA